METCLANSTIKQLDRRGGHNRYGRDLSFFKQWSDRMAYVLGFFYADGDMVDAVSSRTQYIKFCSVDREIIEKIKAAMGAEHLIYKIPPRTQEYRNGTYNSRESFILRIGSREMFNDLTCFGLIPRKSKNISFPKVPEQYLDHFIRGYFDGDGCVYLRKEKGIMGSVILKQLSVIFTSGSPSFLTELSKVLSDKLFLKRREVHSNNRAFQLRYYTHDSVKVFKFLYGQCAQKLYLKRKFDIFKEYFNLSQKRVDQEILAIIKDSA